MEIPLRKRCNKNRLQNCLVFLCPLLRGHASGGFEDTEEGALGGKA